MKVRWIVFIKIHINYNPKEPAYFRHDIISVYYVNLSPAGFPVQFDIEKVREAHPTRLFMAETLRTGLQNPSGSEDLKIDDIWGLDLSMTGRATLFCPTFSVPAS